MGDSRDESGKVQMNLKHITVLQNKDMLRERWVCQRGTVAARMKEFPLFKLRTI